MNPGATDKGGLLPDLTDCCTGFLRLTEKLPHDITQRQYFAL